MAKQLGPVAILRGGFRNGWLYYVADLEIQQRAYDRIGHGLPFDYRATGRREAYPGEPGRTVAVWAAS